MSFNYRKYADALIQPLNTRDSELNRSPGRVKVTGETGPSSEPSKELHYAGVIPPSFLDSAIAASWVAGGESLSFHGQVCLRINIGSVKRNVAQPCSDCVEVNASAKQVRGGCMADRMRANPFGFQRRDLCRRPFRMTRYKRVYSKPCYGIAISI